MLISCPECEQRVSDKALACPYCGFPINTMVSMVSPTKQEKRQGGGSRNAKRLPNGFGSIKKLSGKRYKPFAAYPPVKEYTVDGKAIMSPAIGYFETYQQAYDALNTFNKSPYDIKKTKMTFNEVSLEYIEFVKSNQNKPLAKRTLISKKMYHGWCSPIGEMPIADIRTHDLQRLLDGSHLQNNSLNGLRSYLGCVFKYAMIHEYIQKNYAQYLVINKADTSEAGQPFTDEQLSILWKNADDAAVQVILILIYSGFRIGALRTLEINIEEGYFRGGIKTKAGKNRTVPIHPAIMPFVIKEPKQLRLEVANLRKHHFYPALEKLGIEFASNGAKHTPHDCRHTFSWLCDKYRLDDISKHMLMGHSLGSDVEKSVYGHRTFEELKTEIEKIQVI